MGKRTRKYTPRRGFRVVVCEWKEYTTRTKARAIDIVHRSAFPDAAIVVDHATAAVHSDEVREAARVRRMERVDGQSIRLEEKKDE